MTGGGGPGVKRVPSVAQGDGHLTGTGPGVKRGLKYDTSQLRSPKLRFGNKIEGLVREPRAYAQDASWTCFDSEWSNRLAASS